MITHHETMKRNVRILRLRLFLQILFLFVIATAAICLLIALDNKYKISQNLNKKISIWIMGRETLFPAMNNTVLISTLIVLLLTIATAISYQLYYKYKYDKERLESAIVQKKRIQMKRFLVFFAFCVFHAMFDFVYEELCVAFQQSLDGVNFKNKYMWVIYLIILGMIIADQLVEVAEIHLLNDKLSLVGDNFEIERKKEKDTWKTWGFKLLGVSLIALSLILISIGLNKLPKSWMKPVQLLIDGQMITFFDNSHNALILSILPIVLVSFVISCLFPALEKLGNKNENEIGLDANNWKNRMELSVITLRKETISLQGGKTLGFALIRVVAVNFAISATNTLQEINLTSPAVILPILQLLIASIILIGLQIFQFCEESEEKQSKNIIMETIPSSNLSKNVPLSV